MKNHLRVVRVRYGELESFEETGATGG